MFEESDTKMGEKTPLIHMTRILIKLNTYVKIGLDWKKKQQCTKINITEKELNFE